MYKIGPSREQKDDSNLTLAHGFLLSMGAFYHTAECQVPHQTHEPRKAASTEPLLSPSPSVHESLSYRTTSQNPRFLVHVPGTLVTLSALEHDPDLVQNLVAISSETIEDKSKGDALSKAFSILQISWFILQCIARYIQHLPITLLEMTALAFAGLSIIMYFLWWYKPLNVKYHISLDGSALTPETHDLKEYASYVNPLWHWVYALDLIPPTFEESVDGYFKDIGYDAFRLYSGAFRFYSGTTREVPVRLVTTLVVGVLFGAIHCAAWSFYFPSYAEMVMWQLSSTAVLIGLFLGSHTGLIMLIGNLVDREWSSRLDRIFNGPQEDRRPWALNFARISWFMTSASSVVYTAGRITLIILALLQLRSLPPFTFCTVQWTTYIPHI